MFSFLEAIAPVQISVDFSLIDDFSASVRLIADTQVHCHLTVVHCSISGDEVSLSTPGAPVEVYEGEALICLVHRIGAIVASGVFEVSCSLYTAAGGTLLVPRALSNLIVTQTRRDEPTTPLAEQQEAQG